MAMKTPNLAITVPVMLVLGVFASGCGDEVPPVDTIEDTTNDSVSDIVEPDTVDDGVTQDRVEEVPGDNGAPDTLPDSTDDVPTDVFQCPEYAAWPSSEDGTRKFGLTMFHWNIQYVPGGLIGTWQDKTISICYDMAGDHAPCEGWTDDVLADWIVRVSFQPILDLYLAHPDWRATFEMPGLMIELIEQRHPDILAKLQCAANSGQIELVSFHYSDQLFLPFPSRDLKWSIDYNRKVFEKAGLPLSKVVFNQEGQSGVGKHRIMAENDYTIDVMHRNLYKYHQNADSEDGVWPYYESTGPGATDPVLVVVGGGVDPTSNIEVQWTFFDDGEVLATPGNPYLAMFTPEANMREVEKFETELQTLADNGFIHTTITDYVDRLGKLGITPNPLLPIADSTWQPPSTEGISRWMGRMGSLGYSLHENDNLIRTGNYEASTCLAAASAVADMLAENSVDVNLERATIDAGYLDLIRAEVSDATGINPWMGEWVYGYQMNQGAMQKCQEAAHKLLFKLGREWAIVDLDGNIVKDSFETMEPMFQFAPTDPADVPVAITLTSAGRNVQTEWMDDGRVYQFTVAIGASDNPTGDDRVKRTVSISMPLNLPDLMYSPGLVEDAVTQTPLANFSLFADQMYLPLANGLIGIGPDLWLVKDCRTVHLAARVATTGTDFTVGFIDETVPPEGDVEWKFYILKGNAEEALGFARLINTNPNYLLVRSDAALQG